MTRRLAPGWHGRRVAMFSVHSCPLAALGGRETGGMNVYVRELSRHLARRGIGVDIYTRRQDPCMPVVVDFEPSARVIHLNAGPATPYEKHRVWDHLPEFIQGVRAFMRHHGLQYDLLHSHYWLSGWVALQLRRRLRVPMVHMAHTLGHPKNAAAQQPWEQEPPRRLRIEAAVVRGSDALIAESPASKEHMIQDYGADACKVWIVPGGVDMDLFRPHDRLQVRQGLALSPTAPVLLFVGRLQPLKGLETLLRAAQVVHRHYADLQVLVVGGGLDAQDRQEAAEVARLQGLADSLGLRDQLRFVKAQPQGELARYYAAADLFVMPSYYESFGMVVLEAMACGTPVIASRVGGLLSTVVPGRTGLLVPPGEWPAFAQGCLELLGSPARCRAFGRAGRQWVRRFAWPGIVAQTLRLYRRLTAVATLAPSDRTLAHLCR